MFEETVYIIFWGLFAVVVLLVIWYLLVPKNGLSTKIRMFTPRDSGQIEVDIRLPYKRFKELYPFSEITYQEYKKMQMERAFKRPVSSQKNKRMVR